MSRAMPETEIPPFYGGYLFYVKFSLLFYALAAPGQRLNIVYSYGIGLTRFACA